MAQNKVGTEKMEKPGQSSESNASRLRSGFAIRKSYLIAWLILLAAVLGLNYPLISDDLLFIQKGISISLVLLLAVSVGSRKSSSCYARQLQIIVYCAIIFLCISITAIVFGGHAASTAARLAYLYNYGRFFIILYLMFKLTNAEFNHLFSALKVVLMLSFFMTLFQIYLGVTFDTTDYFTSYGGLLGSYQMLSLAAAVFVLFAAFQKRKHAASTLAALFLILVSGGRAGLVFLMSAIIFRKPLMALFLISCVVSIVVSNADWIARNADESGNLAIRAVSAVDLNKFEVSLDEPQGSHLRYWMLVYFTDRIIPSNTVFDHFFGRGPGYLYPALGGGAMEEFADMEQSFDTVLIDNGLVGMFVHGGALLFVLVIGMYWLLYNTIQSQQNKKYLLALGIALLILFNLIPFMEGSFTALMVCLLISLPFRSEQEVSRQI